jgi:negative regulator of sigma E activity
VGGAGAVFRVTRQVVIVVGAGALGAALCSTTVRLTGMGEDTVNPVVRTRSTGAVTPRPLTGGERKALEVLQRAAAAEQRTPYQGVKFVYAGSQTGVLVDVTHDPDDGTRVHLRSGETPGGEAGRLVAGTGEIALNGLAFAALSRRYGLSLDGVRQCNGRRALAVRVSRLSDQHTAAQFQIDEDTGLMLRRTLFDPDGAVVRDEGYVELAVQPSVPAQRGPSPDATSNPEQFGLPDQQLDTDDLAELRRHGWPLPDALPDGMTLVGARSVPTRKDGKTGDAVQLSFSDGVFSMSLFVQRGQLAPSALDGFHRTTMGRATVYTRDGLYRHAVWSGGGYVFTAVGDLHADGVRRAVLSLPHQVPDGSVLARLGRGIDRVGSWVNPLD